MYQELTITKSQQSLSEEYHHALGYCHLMFGLKLDQEEEGSLTPALSTCKYQV